MTPENPDYNLLIAVFTALAVLYFCVQEILIGWFFTDQDLEEMRKNKEDHKES